MSVETSLVEQRDALLQYAMALEERNGKVASVHGIMCYVLCIYVCGSASAARQRLPSTRERYSRLPSTRRLNGRMEPLPVSCPCAWLPLFRPKQISKMPRKKRRYDDVVCSGSTQRRRRRPWC